MTVAPSYAVLCFVQAAVVAAPNRTASRHGRGWIGIAAPAIALGVGVAVLDRASWGPHALALLGSFATPVLAAAAGLLGGRRLWWLWPPAAAVLWVVAWRAHGLPAQAAEVALVAGACLAIAAAAALVAPAWSLQLGLVVLAALDVVLVWGTPQVEPASKALHGVTLPTAAGATIPKLQDVTFGSAEMGWLDLLAPALLGVAIARGAKLRAAVVTGLAGGAWGLLLFFTSTVPATVPTLAGLVAARPRMGRQ
ncbi:MAG: hypothetical protein ACXVRE_10090 [Gaiellaceae bacterium]